MHFLCSADFELDACAEELASAPGLLRSFISTALLDGPAWSWSSVAEAPGTACASTAGFADGASLLTAIVRVPSAPLASAIRVLILLFVWLRTLGLCDMYRIDSRDVVGNGKPPQPDDRCRFQDLERGSSSLGSRSATGTGMFESQCFGVGGVQIGVGGVQIATAYADVKYTLTMLSVNVYAGSQEIADRSQESDASWSRGYVCSRIRAPFLPAQVLNESLSGRYATERKWLLVLSLIRSPALSQVWTTT